MVAVAGPESAGGEAGASEPSRGGDLLVPAHVLDDAVACTRQQLNLSGEYHIFAARLLIAVVDEQHLHGSGGAVREPVRTNRTASKIRPATNAGVRWSTLRRARTRMASKSASCTLRARSRALDISSTRSGRNVQPFCPSRTNSSTA